MVKPNICSYVVNEEGQNEQTQLKKIKHGVQDSLNKLRFFKKKNLKKKMKLQPPEAFDFLNPFIWLT